MLCLGIKYSFSSSIGKTPTRVTPTLSRRLDKPEINTERLRNMTAVEGDEVTFICATTSTIKPTYLWIKWIMELNPENFSASGSPFIVIKPVKYKLTLIWEPEVPLSNNKNLYVQKLRITNVSLSDGGKYTCSVGHSAGFVSEHAFLTIVRKGKSVLTTDTPIG